MTSSSSKGWFKLWGDLRQEEQGHETSPSDPLAPDPDSQSIRLGKLATESKLATPQDVEACLLEKLEARARGEELSLGELLVRRGHLGVKDLWALLKQLDGHRHALDRYEMRERLGEGATAVIYRAYDTELRRDVAIKLLRDTLGHSATARERFRREARAAAGLTHPNVVPVYDSGEIEGQLYLVMELVQGDTLSARMASGRPDDRRAAEVMEKACRGVAAAHEHGIIHRDLKPSNILVTDAGDVKVTDFGLALRADSSLDLTNTGAVLGTPLYMAPEQLNESEGDLSPRADVYALGATLYEVITGRPPYDAKNLQDLYASILKNDPPSPRRLNPQTSPELEKVVLKALDKDPARRYAHAGEMADDLGRFLRGEPVLARPAGPLARAWRHARRHRWKYGTGAAAAAALLTGALAWTSASGSRRAVLVQLQGHAKDSLDKALEARRKGANDLMASYLPSLERAYREATTRAPDLAEPHYWMGRFYRALMDRAKALEFQERALLKDPSYGPALYERILLRSYHYGERLQAAFEKTGDMTTLDTVMTADRSLRALGEEISKDAAALEDRLRLRPDIIDKSSVLAARGIIACHRRQYEEAERWLGAAVDLNPILEEAWEMLAVAALAPLDPSPSTQDPEERWKKAERRYAEGLKHDRGYVPHLLGRCQMLLWIGGAGYERGEYDVPLYTSVENDATEAMRLGSADGRAFEMRGHARFARALGLRKAGADPSPDMAMAKEDFLKARELKPLESIPLKWLWVVQWSQGLMVKHLQQGDPLPEWEAAMRDLTAACETPAGEYDWSLWSARGKSRYEMGLEWEARGDHARAKNAYAAAVSDLERSITIDPSQEKTVAADLTRARARLESVTTTR